MSAKRQNGLVAIQIGSTARALDLHANMPSATVGVPYVGVVWVDGGAGANVLTLVGKPAWMTGTLVPGFGYTFSGNPTTGGSGFVTVSVTDGASTTTQRAYYVRVYPSTARQGGERLLDGSQPPPAYTGNVAYQYDVGTLLNAPTLPIVSAALTSGTLPVGMSLATSGANAGKVTAANVTGSTSSVVITLTDTAGVAWAVPLTFPVKPGLSVSVSLPIGVVGQAYTGRATVTGGSGKYSAVATNLRPGLAMNPRSGKVGGNPASVSTAGAPASVVVTVTDLVTGQQIVSGGTPHIVGSLPAPAVRGAMTIFNDAGTQDTFDLLSAYFGGGIDGDFVLDGTNTYPGYFSKSSSKYTLTADALYARNITISGSAQMYTNARKVYWSGIMDITAATAAGAINSDYVTATVGPTPGSPGTAFDLGTGGTPTTGGVGALGTSATPPATPATLPYALGGLGGFPGGLGGGALSGTGTAQGSDTRRPVPMIPHHPLMRSGDAQVPNGGCAGASGGGGAGAGGGAGGQGGAGGPGAGVLALFGRWLKVGASTPAAVIRALGGQGGDGSTGPAINRGGGGAGNGGGGGFIFCVFGGVIFDTITSLADAIQSIGANGGFGGPSGGGTGVVGQDGHGQVGGNVVVINLSLATVYAQTTVNTSGRIGGATKVSL